MNDEKSDDIKSSDVELTEQELNKIFFSPGDTKFHPPDVKKLEKKKKQSVIELVEEKPKPIEEPEEVKKPQGRPKKWTKEKIAELKALQRRESELKKKQKDELLDVAKSAMITPVSEYERIKIIRKTLDRRKEIETELVQQKTDNRKVLNQKENITLWNKPKCKRHGYKILYIDTSNNVIASCGTCSEQKSFSISEWQRYIQTTRRLYNE